MAQLGVRIPIKAKLPLKRTISIHQQQTSPLISFDTSNDISLEPPLKLKRVKSTETSIMSYYRTEYEIQQFLNMMLFTSRTIRLALLRLLYEGYTIEFGFMLSFKNDVKKHVHYEINSQNLSSESNPTVSGLNLYPSSLDVSMIVDRLTDIFKYQIFNNCQCPLEIHYKGYRVLEKPGTITNTFNNNNNNNQADASLHTTMFIKNFVLDMDILSNNHGLKKSIGIDSDAEFKNVLHQNRLINNAVHIASFATGCTASLLLVSQWLSCSSLYGPEIITKHQGITSLAKSIHEGKGIMDYTKFYFSGSRGIHVWFLDACGEPSNFRQNVNRIYKHGLSHLAMTEMLVWIEECYALNPNVKMIVEYMCTAVSKFVFFTGIEKLNAADFFENTILDPLIESYPKLVPNCAPRKNSIESIGDHSDIIQCLSNFVYNSCGPNMAKEIHMYNKTKDYINETSLDHYVAATEYENASKLQSYLLSNDGNESHIECNNAEMPTNNIHRPTHSRLNIRIKRNGNNDCNHCFLYHIIQKRITSKLTLKYFGSETVYKLCVAMICFNPLLVIDFKVNDNNHAIRMPCSVNTKSNMRCSPIVMPFNYGQLTEELKNNMNYDWNIFY